MQLKINKHNLGNWEQYFPIPSDRGGYDTFEILREELDSKLRALLEEEIFPDDTKSTQSVKLLYKSCMNTGTMHEVVKSNPCIEH